MVFNIIMVYQINNEIVGIFGRNMAPHPLQHVSKPILLENPLRSERQLMYQLPQIFILLSLKD